MKMIHKHIDGVKASAQFSKDKKYRYRLEIVFESVSVKGRTVCAVMQNPSYAGEDRADKSVQFLEKVIFQRGLPEFHEKEKGTEHKKGQSN